MRSTRFGWGLGGTFNVTVTVTNVQWGETILDDNSPGNFVSGNAHFANP